MSLYPPSAPSQYPKTKYHPSGGSIVVDDHAHELMFGPPWSDNPFPVAAPVPVAEDKPKRAVRREIETGGATWPAARGGNNESR